MLRPPSQQNCRNPGSVIAINSATMVTVAVLCMMLPAIHAAQRRTMNAAQMRSKYITSKRGCDLGSDGVIITLGERAVVATERS